MTSFALDPAPTRSAVLAALADRHRRLTIYGLAMLGLGVVAVALQLLDPRMLASGVGIWAKPAKFFISIGVFALTAAWFFGYVRPERRGSIMMRATAAVLIAAGTFELAYICFQAVRGLESHFNIDSQFHFRMYQLMGVGAVLLVGTTLPLAWEIARRPADGLQGSFVAAVAIGLVLTFLLGGGLGGYMSSQLGHSVGVQGGHVPLFGWNRLGGDLRIAHFLGIHAEQAIPILAALVAGAATRTRWLVLVAGTIAYSALTIALFAQALAGRALIPA